MNLTGIISISGKPGLYKVVGQSKNSIIVESIKDGKRMPAYASNRISALEDISIYTIEEDVPLREVYQKIFEKEQGKEAPPHKEDIDILRTYLESILPDYDKDKVYDSDLRKLFQWYNILHRADLLSVEEEEGDKEVEAEKAKEPKKEEEPKKEKKKTAKKESAKKAPAKKKTAKKDEEKAAPKKVKKETKKKD